MRDMWIGAQPNLCCSERECVLRVNSSLRRGTRMVFYTVGVGVPWWVMGGSVWIDHIIGLPFVMNTPQFTLS